MSYLIGIEAPPAPRKSKSKPSIASHASEVKSTGVKLCHGQSIHTNMALQEVTASFLRRLRTQNTALSQTSSLQCRRHASTSAPVAREIQDLEETDFVKKDPAEAANIKYDPLHRSRSFEGRPPSSRHVNATSSVVEPPH